MKTIQLSIPDSFTDEQIKSMTQTFLNQIEMEIRNTVVIPQTEIDRVEAEVVEVKQAMKTAQQSVAKLDI